MGQLVANGKHCSGEGKSRCWDVYVNRKSCNFAKYDIMISSEWSEVIVTKVVVDIVQ